MMSIKVNTNQLDAEVSKKLGGMYEMTSSRTYENIAKVAFTVGSHAFIRKLNVYAAAHPKAYHHVYEWKKIGSTKDKLFQIERKTVAGGWLKVNYKFLPSKSVVPIPAVLRRPGKSGRSVTKKFIFKNKAAVMEKGRPTKSFMAKSGVALAFVGKGKQPLFIRKPRTVSINKPGGRYVKGAFENQFRKFFSKGTNIKSAVSKTAYFKNLEIGVARTLNKNGTGRREVALVITEISNKYSKGLKVI